MTPFDSPARLFGRARHRRGAAHERRGEVNYLFLANAGAARRGRNRAAVAVARKLCVAVWHVLQGHVIGARGRLDTLQTKLGKFATELGLPAIKELGYKSKTAFIEQKLYLLKSYPDQPWRFEGNRKNLMQHLIFNQHLT